MTRGSGQGRHDCTAGQGEREPARQPVGAGGDREWFCLSDDNPLTGRPYATSRSYELPPYVLDAVEEGLGITAVRWNELVRRGEVYTVTGPRQRFSRTCEDCWGTLATHDYDASVTGSARNVFLCSCTMGLRGVASWR